MILIGTDEGIYRWFEGCNWPIFHSLQHHSIVGLASPGAGVLAAVSAAGGVFESTNNGLDWRPLPLPEGGGVPTAVACDGSPSSIVLAVKPLGVYRRAVGAPTPRPRPEGGRLGPTILHRARDLGGAATALLAPGRVRAEPGADDVRLAGWSALAAPHPTGSADDPKIRALATTSGGWFAAVSGAGLWKSDDAGRSWRPCAGLPVEVSSVRSVPGRAGHLWAATHVGCYLSTDAGETWEDRSAGLENARRVTAVEVKPGEPDTLLAGAALDNPPGPSRPGQSFGLFESANGGKSWAQVKRNFPDVIEADTITDIRHDPVAPDNVIVALGSGELWNTTNGGAYWGPLARQIRAARVLCAAS